MSELTIPLNDRLMPPFVATVGQTTFPYDFPITADTELLVTLRRAGVESTLIPPGQMGAQYSVTGVGNQAGGNVVLTAGAADGDIIAIAGAKLPERVTNFQPPPNSPTATDFNTELNRLIALVQELTTKAGRSIHLRPSDAVADLLLPLLADRQGAGAGTILGFGADGLPRVFVIGTVSAGVVGPSGQVDGLFALFDGNGGVLKADNLQAALHAAVFN